VFVYNNESPDFTTVQTASTTAPNQFDGTSDSPKIDFIYAIRDEVQSNIDLTGVAGVATLTEINSLWPLLTRNCTKFRVIALDSNMNPFTNSVNPALNGSGTWTKADDEWPAAIKVTMTLKDPELLDRAGLDPDDPNAEFEYEIICPVRP
jgi:hypothetical protein